MPIYEHKFHFGSFKQLSKFSDFSLAKELARMSPGQTHNGFSHHFEPGKRMSQRHRLSQSIRRSARGIIGFYIGM